MKRAFRSFYCLLCWLVLAAPSGAELAIEGSNWNGFTKQSFELKGKRCFVVEPAIAAPGKPWVWRASFPDYHPEIDLELLHKGFHVGFIDCVDMLGADSALDDAIVPPESNTLEAQRRLRKLGHEMEVVTGSGFMPTA